MFAVLRDGPDGREIVGVFPYRSIAQAHAKNLSDAVNHGATTIQALPFDSYADGYLPADDQRD